MSRLDRKLLRTAVGGTLAAEGYPAASVSLVFVDDRRIRALHKRFFRDDTPTDVITFPMHDGDFLGEIVVSTSTARRVAREMKIPVREEILRYAVHGALHLAGYRDDGPRLRAKMWKRQEEIVANFATQLTRSVKPAL